MRVTVSLSDGRATAGFTLLEVILALTLFVVSMASLGELMSIGMRASAQSRIRSQAMLLCETKLNEYVAGVLPLTSIDGQAIEGADSDAWSYSVTVQEGDRPGLLLLGVTVSHDGEHPQTRAAVSLWRYIRDPDLFLQSSSTTVENTP